MTTYAGRDLLLIPPNARAFVDEHDTSVTRETARAENPQGNVVTVDAPAPPGTAFTLEWVCGSLPELTALRAFLNARRGQLAPCWIPTYQRDIQVLSVVPFFGTVVESSEASTLVPIAKPWRYWFISGPRGLRYATAYWDLAADQFDGTHVWNTSAGAGPTNVGNIVDPSTMTTANGFVHSRLRCCRMARDDYRIRRSGKLSFVSADFVEIGAEAP